MAINPQTDRAGRNDEAGAAVKSDVAVVPQPEGSAMVAFHLEDGEGSLSCLLTQAQAEALSNALILAADRARFMDASRPRTPLRARG